MAIDYGGPLSPMMIDAGNIRPPLYMVSIAQYLERNPHLPAVIQQVLGFSLPHLLRHTYTHTHFLFSPSPFFFIHFSLSVSV
jgi:hypothetical protein